MGLGLRWLAQDSISIRDDQLLLCKLEGVEEGARQQMNSSVLLSSTLRKLAQLAGMDARPTTRHLTPFPLLALSCP